jgi:hypothetical protein
MEAKNLRKKKPLGRTQRLPHTKMNKYQEVTFQNLMSSVLCVCRCVFLSEFSLKMFLLAHCNTIRALFYLNLLLSLSSSVLLKFFSLSAEILDSRPHDLIRKVSKGFCPSSLLSFFSLFLFLFLFVFLRSPSTTQFTTP